MVIGGQEKAELYGIFILSEHFGVTRIGLGVTRIFSRFLANLRNLSDLLRICRQKRLPKLQCPSRILMTPFSFSALFLLCFFEGIFQRIWADEVFLSLACSDIFSLPNALGTLPMLKKNRCCWFWRAIGRAGLASKVFRCFWWGCSWAALWRRLDQCYLEVLVDFR